MVKNKLSIARSPRRSLSALTTCKALALVTMIWGVAYPALLWGIGALLQA